MGLQTIRDIQTEAAHAAARRGKFPLVIFNSDTVEDDIKHLPNLGDYEPEGWDLILLSKEGIDELLPQWQQRNLDFLFVDKGGWGREGEAALTFEQFCKCVAILVDHFKGKTIGFGIWDEGQFQINVGVYRKLAVN